jgi:hypothetical protein
LSSPVGEAGDLIPDHVKKQQAAIYDSDQRPFSRRCMRGSEESSGEKPEENALFLDGSDANFWHIGVNSPCAQSTGGLPLGTSYLELDSLEDCGTDSPQEQSSRETSARSRTNSGRSRESSSRTSSREYTNSDRSSSRTSSREFGSSGASGTLATNQIRSRGSTPRSSARGSRSTRTASPGSPYQNSPNSHSVRGTISHSPQPVLIKAASSPYLKSTSASHTVTFSHDVAFVYFVRMLLIICCVL